MISRREKQPKSDTTSADGPSTFASYALFWSLRRRPLVGSGNVTALQEQKLATEVRRNYPAFRFMPISYPEQSLYFSFHCATNKQTNKHENNTKSISLVTNSGASGSCLKRRFNVSPVCTCISTGSLIRYPAATCHIIVRRLSQRLLAWR